MRKKGKRYLSIFLSAVLSASLLAGIPQATEAANAMVRDEDLTDGAAEGPAAWGAVPNEEQLYYMNAGLAAFCHFGPNTYNNKEWGETYEQARPKDIFTLKRGFDAEGIVKAVKEAGYSRLILTLKHHDGLCLWNTNLTTYSIWDQGEGYQGDLFEELSDACTKYNLDMGCYLSPWDIHEDKYGCFGDNNNGPNSKGYTDYNKLYIDSIKEICTAKKADGSYKYGNNNPNRRSDRFVEWWMDGAQGSANNRQTFDWKGIIGEIRKENRNCQIFGTHAAVNGKNGAEDAALASTGGIHWIGNESGYASHTTWAKVTQGKSYEDQTLFPRENGAIQGKYDGNQWSVPEVDVRMLSGWFWTESAPETTLKSKSKLAEIYFNSVGHGATLLLNLSPNQTGAVAAEQLDRFKWLGETAKQMYANDLTKAANVTATATSVWKNAKKFSPKNVIDSKPDEALYDDTYWAPAEGQTTGSIEIDLGGVKTFDVVSLEEYIKKGQAISEFSIEYKNVRGVWSTFAEGTTISSKRLCRRSPVEGTAVRVNIEASYSTPMITNIGVYKAPEGFETGAQAVQALPSNLKTFPVRDMTMSGTWGYEKLDGTQAASKDVSESAWSNTSKNGTAQFKFTGTKAWIYGTKDPGHGMMKVNIDGTDIATVDTSQTTARSMNALLYVTPELAYGEHTVLISCPSGAVGLHRADYADGSGIFTIEKKSYGLTYGKTADVKIVRTCGSKGRVSVVFSTESGSAEQGVNYTHKVETVVFEEGEREKTVTVEAKDKNGSAATDNRIVDGKQFYVGLREDAGAAERVSLEPDAYAEVVLYNADGAQIVEDCEAIGLGAYSKTSGSAFAAALAELKKLRAAGQTGDALKEAGKRLLDAKNALEENAGPYLMANPCVFPGKSEESKTVEAEDFLLDSTGASDSTKPVRISTVSYGNGKVVDQFTNGNKIKLPFYAAKAGFYEVTAYYRSNALESAPNLLNWSGATVEDGSIEASGEADASVNHEVSFELKVKEKGDGELVFTADRSGAPTLDKFRIVYKRKLPDSPAVSQLKTQMNDLAEQAQALLTSGDTSSALYQACQAVLTALAADETPPQAELTALFETLKREKAAAESSGGNQGGNGGDGSGSIQTPENPNPVPEGSTGATPDQNPSQIPSQTPSGGQTGQKETVVSGKTYTVGAYTYEAIDLAGRFAAVTGLADAKTKKVKVPNTVELVTGETFTVTRVKESAFKGTAVTDVMLEGGIEAIGKNAFAGCKKLKKVTIKGNGLKTIEANAFNGCKLLKTIVLSGTGIQKVASNAFKGIHKSAAVKVPAKMRKEYAKKFKKIKVR